MMLIEKPLDEKRGWTASPGPLSTNREIADAAWDAALYAENTNASSAAMERVYDEASDAVETAGGPRLDNPMRVNREGRVGIVRVMEPDSDLVRGDTGDPHIAFHLRLEALAKENPKIAAALGNKPFNARERARDLARESEERLGQMIRRRGGFWSALGPSLAGGFAGGLSDPAQVAAMVAGGGVVKGFVKSATMSAAINAATEAALQPYVQAWRKEAGLPSGFGEAAANVAIAGGFGFAFDLGLSGAKAGFRGIDAVARKRWPTRAEAEAALTAAAERLAPENPIAKAFAGDADALVEVARDLPDLPPEARGAVHDLEHRIPRPEKTDIDDAEIAAAQARRWALAPEDYPPTRGVEPMTPETIPTLRDREGDFVSARATNEPPPGVQERAVPPHKGEATLTVLGKPVAVEKIDAGAIGFAAEDFQYKGDGDGRGVTERLEKVGRWDGLAAGQPMVFERASGEIVIADGHQRLGLAKRLVAQGREEKITFDAWRFREADGWTIPEVKALAAKRNIQQGSGTALDTARILREVPELLDASVPRAGLRQAVLLSRLSPEAFAMAEGGVVPLDQAAAVADFVTDPTRHTGMIEALAREKPDGARQARLMIADMMQSPASVETQMDLLGVRTVTRTLYKERAQVLDAVLQSLRSDKRVFSTLTREGERIEDAGNVLAQEANARAAEVSGQMAELIEKLATRHGSVSDRLNAAAMRIADGEKVAAVGRDLFADLRTLFEERGVAGLMDEGALPRAGESFEPGSAEAKAEGDAIAERLGIAELRSQKSEVGSGPDVEPRRAAEPSLFSLRPADEGPPDPAFPLPDGATRAGEGQFGPVLDGLQDRWADAVTWLRGARTGDAIGVLAHPDVGQRIDVVWGDERAGLKHIIDKHPYVLPDLPERLSRMTLIEQRGNLLVLATEDGAERAIITTEGRGAQKTWLLTAYERGRSADSVGEGADGLRGMDPSSPTRPAETDISAAEPRVEGLLPGDPPELAAAVDYALQALPDDVRIRVTEFSDPEVQGGFNKRERILYLSARAIDQRGAAGHEAVHAVRDLFTEKEWRTLTDAAARAGARDAYGIDTLYRDRYARQFNDPELLEAALLEETVARMSEDRAGGKSFDSVTDALLDRLAQFFERLRNALNGAGFQTAEDVFRRIDRGDVGRRGPSPRGDGTRFSLRPDANDDPLMARMKRILSEAAFADLAATRAQNDASRNAAADQSVADLLARRAASNERLPAAQPKNDPLAGMTAEAAALAQGQGYNLAGAHTTLRDFEAFDPGQAGTQTDSGYLGVGIYFEPKDAILRRREFHRERYGTEARGYDYFAGGKHGARNVDAVIRTEKPFVAYQSGARDAPTRGPFADLAEAGYPYGDFPFLVRSELKPRAGETHDEMGVRISAEFTAAARARGYDVVLSHDENGKLGEIVVLDPSRIRSRRAAFDPARMDDPDFMASLRPVPQQQLLNLGLSGPALATRVEAEKAHRSYQQVKQIEVTDALDRAFTNHRNARGEPDPAAALIAMIEHHGRFGFSSVAGRMNVIIGLAHAQMTDALHEFRRTKLGGTLRNLARAENMVRELFGENTGDAAAKAMAEAWMQTAEALRQRFNKAGGAIAKLEHWGLPQEHNRRAVARAGGHKDKAAAKAAWIDYTKPLLDPARMKHPLTGAALTPAELDATLDHVWRSIVSEGWNEREASRQATGRGALANQRLDHRYLVFKDAASWLQYSSDFGGGKHPFAAMMRHVTVMARDIASMEIFGPNPDATFEWLKQRVAREAANAAAGDPAQFPTVHPKTGLSFGRDGEQNYANRAVARAEAMWKQVRGTANMPVDTALAAVVDGAANLVTSSTLGSASLTAVTDLGYQKWARGFAGIGGSVLKDVVSQFSSMSRREAVAGGLIAESMQNTLLNEARYVGAMAGPEWTRWLADRTLTWSGLAPWTQAGRHAMGLAIQTEFGSRVKLGFAELPDALRLTLERWGFDAGDWDKIRAAKPQSVRGAKFLRPQDIADAGHEGLDERYLEMLLGEVEFAVPSGTLRARSIVAGDTRPGTLHGAMVRVGGQFKSFAVVVAMLQGGRILHEVTGGRAARGVAYAGGLLVATTLMGAVAMQLKAVAAGRDPRDMTDPNFWGQAILQGGGLGIFGDFLFGEINRFGRGLGTTLAGPLAERGTDLINLTVGNIAELAEGKDTHFAREALDFAHRNAPGASIWYARLAAERLVIDQLKYLADPQAMKRFRAREQFFKKHYGQESWWRPGRAVPDRAPDFSRVMQ